MLENTLTALHSRRHKVKKKSEPSRSVSTLLKGLIGRAVRTKREMNKEAGTQEKIDSISNKELNPT